VTSSMIMKTYYHMGLLHIWWSMVLKFRSLELWYVFFTPQREAY